MAKVQQKTEKTRLLTDYFFSRINLSLCCPVKELLPLPPICLRCDAYFRSVKYRCTTAASEDSAENIQILL